MLCKLEKFAKTKQVQKKRKGNYAKGRSLVGEKINKLMVLCDAPSKKDTRGYWHSQYWCLCDCGKKNIKTRQSLVSKKAISCGCAHKDASRNQIKPLLEVGQKFNFLTVIGLPETFYSKTGQRTSKYKLKCDCGKIIYAPRSAFANDNPRQKSCGCFRKSQDYDNGRRVEDITGQRHGSLVADHLLDQRTKNGKTLWVCICDCGNSRVMSRHALSQGFKLNCGAKEHSPCSWYPPMPSPMPEQVGQMIEKYLPLAKTRLKKRHSLIEDMKLERLIRCAWIIHYREVFLGENMSDLHKNRYIKKSLRYISIDAFWKEKIEQNGGLLYNSSGQKKEIGSDMTNITFPPYPVFADTGENLLLKEETKNKKLSFLRR